MTRSNLSPNIKSEKIQEETINKTNTAHVLNE
jgi:hypothetical protein